MVAISSSSTRHPTLFVEAVPYLGNDRRQSKRSRKWGPMVRDYSNALLACGKRSTVKRLQMPKDPQ
jgi:hypothetical protein